MEITQKGFLKPGVYRFGKQLIEMTAEQLKKIANATNKMLSSGIAVPLLDGHAAPGAVGPGSRKASDNVGWLKRVKIEKDGSLSQQFDVTDPSIREKAKNGSIRFTSPEIGSYVDGTGRDHGTVIRHMALTPAPRNPDQGGLECLQLSEDDYVGSTAENTISFSEMEKNMTTAAEDLATQGALFKLASDSGIAIPSDLDLSTNEGRKQFFSLVQGSKQMSEDKGEEKKDKEPNQPNGLTKEEEKNMTTEVSTAAGIATQYSEEARAEINLLKERLDAKDAEAARANLAGQIERADVAPHIKKVLSDRASTVQFSDANTTLLSIPEVLTMVAEAYKGIQFSEEDNKKAKDEEHPDGTQAFSEEDPTAKGEYTAERLEEINNHFNKPRYQVQTPEAK